MKKTWLPIVLLTSLLLCLGKMAQGVWLTHPVFDRLPTWDPSAHLMDGVVFAEALRRFNPLLFLEQLSLSSYWPPLYPLIEAPVFILFGYSIKTATILMWVIALACVALLIWHQFAYRETASKLAVIPAALLFALSPAMIAYSGVIMLELPGVLFSLLASGCYAIYLSRDREDLAWWRYTCIATSLLFFCKYNYWVIWLGSLVTFEFFFNPLLRQRVLAFCHEALRQYDRRSAFNWFCVAYLALLVFVVFAGGIDTVILGQHIVFKSVLGNPIYGLIALVLVRYALFKRAELKNGWRLFFHAREPFGTFNRYLVLPVVVWLTYPANFSTFLSFLVNQSKRDSFFSKKTLFFYPNYFVTEVTFNTFVGAAILVGFFGGLLFWRKWRSAEKFMFWFALLGYISCVIHPNYIDRYLLTVAPFMMLAGCLTWMRLLQLALPEKVLADLTLAATLGVVVLVPHNSEYQSRFIQKETRSQDVFSVIDPICKVAQQNSPTNVVGFNSEMGPDLVAWRCWSLYPELLAAALPRTINRIPGLTYHMDPEDILASRKVANFAVITYDLPVQNDAEFIYRKDEYLALKATLERSPHVALSASYDIPAMQQHVKIFQRLSH